MKKICTKCSGVFDFSEFTKEKNCIGGIGNTCKTCRNKRQAELRKKNPQAAKESRERYKKKNQNYHIEYRKKNKDRISARDFEYRQKNIELFIEKEKLESRDRRKRLSKEEHEKIKEKQRSKAKIRSASLNRGYVLTLLTQRTEIKKHDITEEIIEAKTQHILLQRSLKILAKEINKQN